MNGKKCIIGIFLILTLLGIGEIILFSKQSTMTVPTATPLSMPAPTIPTIEAKSWHSVICVTGASNCTSELFEIKSARAQITWEGDVAGVSKMADAAERWYADRNLEIIGVDVYFANGTRLVGCSPLSACSEHTLPITFPAAYNGEYYLSVTVEHLQGSFKVTVEDFY